CPPPSSPTPFPYTTLFRSRGRLRAALHLDRDLVRVGPPGSLELRRGRHRLTLRRRDHIAWPQPRLRGQPRVFDGILELGQRAVRSEEHTSELQSPYDLVCR